jgi:hypothetical protein
MKLSECTFGKIVFNEGNGVGMIKGLSNNIPSADKKLRAEVDRAVVIVDWSCGETTTIHPSNLTEWKH